MNRTVRRTYTLSPDETRNAIVDWLNKHNIESPRYIGNVQDTEWTHCKDGTVQIDWVENDNMPD